MIRNRLARAVTLVLAATLASIAVVSATPGSGATGTILSRGTLEAPVRLTTSALKLQVRDDTDVVTQTITILPGGHTGWHSHPGPVFVTIVAGAMTFYDADDPACSPVVYGVGDAFVDRGGDHAHMARNEGSIDLVLGATYLLPPGAALRTDAADPGTCPF